MNEKRYAIVRVDKAYYLNSCPAGFEEINNDFVCSYKESKTYSISINCKKCRYGDTKEQLIRKVAQASINYYESRPFSKVNFQDMARWIVEFLGVE